MALKRSMNINGRLLEDAIERRAFLLMDGGMGTLIQSRGLHEIHGIPDLLNITHPSDIEEIQRAYVEAGADCITTNTFSSNRLKLEGTGVSVAAVYEAAANIARNSGAKLVAGDIGPTGALLEPLGTCSFEDAYEVFSEQAKAAEGAGCDLILIETMTDLLEAKAAVLAAVENTSIPVFATMSFGEDDRTVLGTTPEIAATTLSSIGACAVGSNCSLGPSELAGAIGKMAPYSRGAVIAQPNAGLPRLVDGKTVFEVEAEEFATSMSAILDAGATVIGGCCGTTPDHIRGLRRLIDARSPEPVEKKHALIVTSAQEMCELPQGGEKVAVIGERINPTGKKKLRDALDRDDMDYLIAEAAAQAKAGSDILDVNVGVPGLDETQLLKGAVRALQATVATPLQLDSSDASAIEAAARIYSGRPIINSVNGTAKSLDEILPIAAHYGCCIVGLTLDEGGIPSTAEGRLDIAKRIIEAAGAHGIPREDISIDCLVMTASTNQDEVREILRTVSLARSELGVHAMLGVSNVSFGLPSRKLLNSTFLAAAFGAGLDMPILDPLNKRYSDTVAAFKLLNGQDAGAREFIDAYANAHDPNDGIAQNAAAQDRVPSATVNDRCPIPITETFKGNEEKILEIADYVLSGRAAPMAAITEDLVSDCEPLAVVNEVFVPLLDEVGVRYDNGAFFLPQLMASAEAVKAGFDVIREASGTSGNTGGPNGANKVIVATVEGDIHDIGKNIVKMLLENYGFDVIDLGRDVIPEAVLEAAKETGARLVGLSALMTTTAPAMERTVKLLHEKAPGVFVMVGGAVVTPEYADSINADFYAKDAAASARIATEFFEELG